MNPMLAYHNDPKLKETILAQLQAHYNTAKIVQGIYWRHGKNCAVGCILHSDDYSLFPTRLGIPTSIGWLISELFDGRQHPEAKAWPLNAMKTIQVGADLSDVTRQFLLRILSDLEKGCLRHTKEGTPQYQVVAKVISLLEQSCKNYTKWEVAWKEAWETIRGVERGAGPSEAAWAAEAAAWAARTSLEVAGVTAFWVTQAAVWATRVDEWAAHCLWMAETLLHLFRNAPLGTTSPLGDSL